VILAHRQVDHFVVVGSDLVMQALGRASSRFGRLVWDRNAVPDDRNRAVDPADPIDDEELRMRQLGHATVPRRRIIRGYHLEDFATFIPTTRNPLLPRTSDLKAAIRPACTLHTDKRACLTLSDCAIRQNKVNRGPGSCRVCPRRGGGGIDVLSPAAYGAVTITLRSGHLGRAKSLRSVPLRRFSPAAGDSDRDRTSRAGAEAAKRRRMAHP
jgi:hypothetical protein